MFFRREIWTYVIVTLVTVLIWFWAAGETRDTKALSARVQFTVADAGSWVINPTHQTMSVAVEGSQFALQQAEQRFRDVVSVQLSPISGTKTVDLLAVLREHSEIEATGVKVESAEPSAIEVRMDEIVRVPARVRPHLPRVQTVGGIEVEPAEVIVSMTRTLRQQLPGDLIVEPQVDLARIERLQPDVRHTIDATLRLAEAVLAGADVTIDPPTAQLSFVVRSRIGETLLESVRVQVAGPPEDSREYVIDVEPTVLRDVRVRADADLISRIAAQEVLVVAMVHLSSREKEQRIERKRASYFLALVPGPNGVVRGQVVEAQVGEEAEMPMIELDIHHKDAP